MLEFEPELGRYLSADERAEARLLRVPVSVTARGGLELSDLLGGEGAFGAVVLDGVLMQQLSVAGHLATRFVGPGDLLVPAGPRTPSLLASSAYTVASETSLAILGDEVLLAARRWPALLAGLHARLTEQLERVATHVAICQLPRVSDRVLGILWLLAESWGHVTPAGVTLPLSLTHDTIGALVGARRSTVTLALGELAQRDAIVRQDRGWLLLERLSTEPANTEGVELPELKTMPSPWLDGSRTTASAPFTHDELRETVAQMRRKFEERRQQVQLRLDTARRTRATIERRRARMARDVRP